MAQYPMTQDALIMRCMELEDKINRVHPVGMVSVDLQRFGDDTSPLYLVIIDDYYMQSFQSFRINRITGIWEVWDRG
jgi:hypothetical protein